MSTDFTPDEAAAIARLAKSHRLLVIVIPAGVSQDAVQDLSRQVNERLEALAAPAAVCLDCQSGGIRVAKDGIGHRYAGENLTECGLEVPGNIAGYDYETEGLGGT